MNTRLRKCMKQLLNRNHIYWNLSFIITRPKGFATKPYRKIVVCWDTFFIGLSHLKFLKSLVVILASSFSFDGYKQRHAWSKETGPYLLALAWQHYWYWDYRAPEDEKIKITEKFSEAAQGIRVAWWVSDSCFSYLICPPKNTFHMASSKINNKNV